MSFPIRFLPEDRTTVADQPTELFLAAAACEIWVEQPCGQKTICGKCKVRVCEGDAPISGADERLLTKGELDSGWRLGCQLTLSSPSIVEIPPATRAVAAKSFGDDALFAGGFEPAFPGVDFGVALDVGSTTLAAALMDLKSGAVRGAISKLNPQVQFGGDVISRIFFAQEHADGNARVQNAVLGAVREMLAELAAQAGVAPERIGAIVTAGNATMTHALVGADITPLGQAPYVGSFREERELRARDIGLPLAADAILRTMPMIYSHVGGDTVAAMLSAGIDQSDGWQLLIDLGTNSEVVLGCRGRMVATSTAAGPAFEGANIYQGMRAVPGAIDAVRISPEGRVVVKTVANESARGICGSGLIDAAAELVRAGVVDPSGYMRSRDQIANAALAERSLRLSDGPWAFRLATDVVITAQDIRQLQLIKGSIYGGVEILLRHCGVSLERLERVNIAGTFGNFIRKTSAQAIGLVPQIDPERVQFVGNAAGIGARMALVDAAMRRRAKEIADRTEYVELAGHEEYQDAFVAAIPFPAPENSTL